MDSELEVIKSEMDQTRSSLADKLNELESQVRDTVVGAGEGVKAVVEGVSDTMSSVKETFNFRHQVEKHPWGAFGVAVGVGAVAAFMLGGRKPAQAASPSPTPFTPSYSPPPPMTPIAATPAAALEAAKPAPAGPDTSWFGGALQSLQGMALESLSKLGKNLVEQVSPHAWEEGFSGLVKDMQVHLDKVMHSASEGVTAALKGQGEQGGQSFEQTLAPEPDQAWTGPRPRAKTGGRK